MSLKRRSIRSNASCSSANSRVGIGRRSTGVKSPDPIRCAAVSRCVSELASRRERPKAISQPARPNARIAKLRAQSDAARLSASDIGIPTLTSHGPFSTAASPYIRRTPSMSVRSTGPAMSCAERMSIGRSCPTYRSASWLLASTRPSRSATVTTEPTGIGSAPSES